MKFLNFFTSVSGFFLEVLFPPRDSELLVRSTDYASLQKLYTPLVTFMKPTQCVTSLLPYSSKVVQAFILEAKFHGNKRAQEFLGRILARHLIETFKLSDADSTP